MTEEIDGRLETESNAKNKIIAVRALVVPVRYSL
jgi:hypothetical protein